MSLPGRRNKEVSIRIPGSSVAVAVALLCCSNLAKGQDLYEIQVYPYETIERRHTMFEFHMNFFPSGTKMSEGGLYPINHQFHLTMEVTHGISEHWEIGGYLLTAYVPDVGPEIAGTHIRPRFRLPEQWHLPFKVSVSTELGYDKPRFNTDTVSLEMRTILEKASSRWYLSLNPDFSKSFRGENAHRGLAFTPSLKITYLPANIVAPGLEYYSDTGFVTHFDPLHQQHHLVFATMDVNASPDWEFNFGLGRGLTGTSEHWTVKWIIGRRFNF